ncbi:MAG: hypothetical protein JWM68_256 [Verrucomicrobiales bacterium]|nr:hypothetical protein [Verrucomicrobiales bacterium]
MTNAGDEHAPFEFVKPTSTIQLNKGALTSIALAINGATLNPTITLLRYPLLVLLALRAAAVTARDNYEADKALLPGMRDAMNVTRLQARAFLLLTRDLLKSILGGEYSLVWDATGLIGSLEIPQSVDDLILLLEAMVAYLTAHPALEAPMYHITAARAQMLLTALSDARRVTDDQVITVSRLMKVRDEKFTAVRKGLRGLIAELNDELDPLDLRWKAFGFNMPGADETPEEATGVTGTLITPTTAAVKWPAAARGGFYHVYQRVQGIDADWRLVGSPADLDFTMENLPNRAHVDIVVAAVNNGGEGPRSEAITIVTQ